MQKLLIIVYLTISLMMVDLKIASATTYELGDYVWNDLNSNGIQDNGEPGMAGVEVFLEDGNYQHLRTTTTDSSGKYWFTGLQPDKYVVEFVAPNGYSFTLKKQGSDLTRDSNANPKGHSDFLTLTANHPVNRNIDAGLRANPVPLPGAALLMGSGLLGLVGLRRFRKV